MRSTCNILMYFGPTTPTHMNAFKRPNHKLRITLFITILLADVCSTFSDPHIEPISVDKGTAVPIKMIDKVEGSGVVQWSDDEDFPNDGSGSGSDSFFLPTPFAVPRDVIHITQKTVETNQGVPEKTTLTAYHATTTTGIVTKSANRSPTEFVIFISLAYTVLAH